MPHQADLGIVPALRPQRNASTFHAIGLAMLGGWASSTDSGVSGNAHPSAKPPQHEHVAAIALP